MSDILLDTNGDIDITEGKFTLTTGLDAIKQHLKQRLKLFYGEWFLDITKGIPYFQHILNKNPNPIVVDAVLKRTIIETPGILELLEFDLNIDSENRELQIDFKARAEDGNVNFSEVVP